MSVVLRCSLLINIGEKHVWGNVSTKLDHTPNQPKINLLLAILGNDDPTNRLQWSVTWVGEGTMCNWTVTFIQSIANDIGPGTPQQRYCFTMDDLAYVT
jgi:hypothetical protein